MSSVDNLLSKAEGNTVKSNGINYNIDAIIGKTYSMHKMGNLLILQCFGEDDIQIDMEKVAIREGVYEQYYWFSNDDYFQQGSECVVHDIDKERGIWYIRNKTWEPSIFASLPSRIIDTNDLTGNEIAPCKTYLKKQDDHVDFINIHGQCFTIDYNAVHVTNGSLMENYWREGMVSVHKESGCTIELLGEGVPTLREFMYAAVD